MKKIFALFAALTLTAGAAMAGSGGGFEWTGTGAMYDSNMNALYLNNANLTSLKIATGPNDKTDYGTAFTINVQGNCKINPTSKIDGITVGGSSYGQNDNIVLNITGQTPDAKLEVSGQLNSAVYFVKNGDLRLRSVELVCNGRLQTAKYGISAATGCSFYLKPYAGVALTLDGKNGQFNNIFSFRPQGTSYAISFPEGATMNTESGNIFFILDGDNYYGKTTIMTGSGVKIGGVELDYTNWDNFTQNVSAGKVSYSMNLLILENAQIDAPVECNAPVSIGCHGENVINGDVTFKSSATFIGADLTINGNVKTHGGEFNILDSHVSVYAPEEAFTLGMSGEYGTMEFAPGSEDRGSLYMEYNTTSVSRTQTNEAIKISIPDDYTVNQYTKDGKNCFHARYIENYGISVESEYGYFTLNNENAQEGVLDGTVKYDPLGMILTLDNANLKALEIPLTTLQPLNITLKGNNRIFRNGNNGMAVITTPSLVFSGDGKLDIITQNDLPAVYMNKGSEDAAVTFKDANVNISASGHAFIGSYPNGVKLNVDHSAITIQSGVAGVMDNVTAFDLSDAEIVSPGDLEFFNGQLCVNYQPLAANTKVVIIPTPKESIENVVLTDKAQKVLIDGQVYIIRDNKMFDLTGVQVR